MLCLTLLPGEYLTIGSDVVVQLDRISGDSCTLAVQAPREIPIVRGAVLEREGGQRPEHLAEVPKKGHRSALPL